MRSVWFAAGVASGLYVLTRGRRAAEALTPEGLEDRLAGLSLGMHLFGQEVKVAMAEKETELRRRLTPELSGGGGAIAPLRADNSVERGSC